MVYLVSGLPRSGTSMLMNMVQAGGMQILTDKLRRADKDNPQGYFEFEPVKKLPQGKTDWLDQAQGKAVKIISELLEYLPKDYDYKVVFINRDLDEVLASQAKMMERRSRNDNVDKQAIKQAFKRHLKEVKQWLADQKNIEVLQVDYNQTIINPEQTAQELNRFINKGLNVDKMAAVVDPSLYRQKNI